MIFRNPEVEIITEENPLKRVEIAGRVCYKSEGKITEDSAIAFVKKLFKYDHTSPLEHARIVIPIKYYEQLNDVVWDLPYGFTYRAIDTIMVRTDKDGRHCPSGGMSLNLRDYFAAGGNLDEVIAGKYLNAKDYMTVRFICDRAIANELVRHRIFSFSQESSRFCCYDKDITFINPIPFENYDRGAKWDHFFDSIALAEKTYHWMIQNGASPQEARNVLPLCTKTELIMTGILGDWDRLIEMRSAKDAHPQMRYLMGLLQKVYKKK